MELSPWWIFLKAWMNKELILISVITKHPGTPDMLWALEIQQWSRQKRALLAWAHVIEDTRAIIWVSNVKEQLIWRRAIRKLKGYCGRWCLGRGWPAEEGLLHLDLQGSETQGIASWNSMMRKGQAWGMGNSKGLAFFLFLDYAYWPKDRGPGGSRKANSCQVLYRLVDISIGNWRCLVMADSNWRVCYPPWEPQSTFRPSTGIACMLLLTAMSDSSV